MDALSFMAMGLFCSLILGLIIKQIALIPGLDFLKDIAALLQSAPVVGGSIGMAIAFGLKCAPLVTISAVAVGALGYQFGGPIGAYLASIVGIEGGSLVSKRTPVSTLWLQMTNNAAGAGMGTAGLVGPLGCWDTMDPTTDHGILHAEIFGLYFIAPAVLSLFFHFIMKRLGWVKDGDMKLQR